MAEIKLIAFDIDGTLIDSRDDIVDAVNFMLERLGLEALPFKQIVSYIGTGVQDLIRQALGSHLDMLEEGLSIFEKYYQQHATNKSRLYPGVKQTLQFLSDKKKLVVVTNRNRQMAESSLEAFGLIAFFDKIFAAKGDSCLKPDPCQLNSIFKQFSFTRSQVMLVGDMDLDVISGKKAGILTCGVTYGIGDKRKIIASKPDYLINNITQLKEIVD